MGSLFQKIIENNLADDQKIAKYLLKEIKSSSYDSKMTSRSALEISTFIRNSKPRLLELSNILHKIGFNTKEGLSLLSLAESLLRIPDNFTIDELIADKLAGTDWSIFSQDEDASLKSLSVVLNMAGSIVGENSNSQIGKFLSNITGAVGAPVLRASMAQVIKKLSNEFILGSNIEEAQTNSKNYQKQGYSFSYDMLGEGARTKEDAEKYFESYLSAISKINNGASISVKISALCPSYQDRKEEMIFADLVDKLKTLVREAIKYNISITLDAEEANRLIISLRLFETVFLDKEFVNFNGFGLAVQAYQKRASFVIDWLSELAKKADKVIPIRLVKGAYWDSEIKYAQVLGLSNYPVFTRKEVTDLSYLVCAKKMLESKNIYPQFATHNAHTVAAIMDMAPKDKDFEFQRLHGMGDKLYEQILEKKYPVRIYAPVGIYNDLLPYLVRRIIENGASVSFVNKIYDKKVSIEKIIADPIMILEQAKQFTHSQVPMPNAIFSEARINSRGIDVNDREEIKRLIKNFKNTKIDVAKNNINSVFEIAQKEFENFAKTKVEDRANIINKVANLLEEEWADFIHILQIEAGKTYDDAISEVREAIDFCRYYASEAIKLQSQPHKLVSYTGEDNSMTYKAKGVFLAISPWNFPLAIFTGQIVAALSVGNTVLAKPASNTPNIAAKMVDLIHRAGINKNVLHLLQESGQTIMSELIEKKQLAGIVFTGSVETAKEINLALAKKSGPIIPFIAETGGQNAMIVDSSALTEQVVDDVIASAFRSAGQRCSALRVLYLQDDIADRTVKMLIGATKELVVGDPTNLSTDIGPVISSDAKRELLEHIIELEAEGKLLYKGDSMDNNYLAPHIFEINKISDLKKENFGPILHIIRYKKEKLADIIEEINNSNYGLTFGMHSRISKRLKLVTDNIRAGNIYLNRNMIGAVVGVQPFGGEGLSGTGFKAGGPNYLLRFVNERTISNNVTSMGGNVELNSLADQ